MAPSNENNVNEQRCTSRTFLGMEMARQQEKVAAAAHSFRLTDPAPLFLRCGRAFRQVIWPQGRREFWPHSVQLARLARVAVLLVRSR